MKKGFFLIGILIAVFATLPQQVRASHAMGASITYKWISDSTYEFTYWFYRDCAGISAPATIELDLEPGSRTITLLSVSSREITPICLADTGHTTCGTGNLPGTQEYIYRGTATLPTAGVWTASYAECCRNAAITNISNALNYELFVSTTINITSIPFDNSPQFLNMPALYLTVGQSYNLNFGAYDIDGDSLSYQFAQPLSASNTPITGYNGGLSYTNPLSSSTPITLDSITGIFSVTPDQVQVGVVAINVNEYRQGQLIGSITRDVQIIVTAGNNNLPGCYGVNGNHQFTVLACANNTLNFTIPSYDIDTADIVTFNVLSQIPGVIYTVDTTARPTLTFAWSPDSTLVSGIPYIFNFELNDNGCPFNGKQAYSIAIYVNNCNNGYVWPGDANNDFVANIYDVLPIGIAYGDTGTTRTNASLNWTAQQSNDWVDLLPSGVNVKNADCNGDGIVDSNDLTAINVNYGLTHNKTAQTSNSSLALTVVANRNTVQAGDTLVMSIMLGDTNNVASNVYGLATGFGYDNRFLEADTSWLQFNGGWMVSGNAHPLSFQKFLPAQQDIDIAATRTDHQNISGSGELGKIRFIVKDPPSGTAIDTQSFYFAFSSPKLVNYSAADVPVSTPTGSVLWHKTTVGIANSSLQQSMDLYPNPTTGLLNVVLPANTKIGKLEVYNLIGEEVQLQTRIDQNTASFELPHAPNGIYLVNIITVDGQRLHKKFTLLRQ